MSASPSPSPRSRTGRSVDRDTPREHHGGGGASRDDNVGTIFVGNLNRDTSERRLREYFDTYGRVLSAKVPFFLLPASWTCPSTHASLPRILQLCSLRPGLGTILIYQELAPGPILHAEAYNT